MAVNPLTPGVYIDEVSVFPPSVAPVATAVPAFIGYTEKGPTMSPTRITSMLEYEAIFGGAYAEEFTATVSGSSVTMSASYLSDFTMHYNLRMYFANGGGPCYIVSVDDYFSAPNTPNTIDFSKLIDGVNATEKADEVTLLVVPEAITTADVNPSQRAAIHSAQLDLCNKMKDRFALMDVVDAAQSVADDASDFRDTEVGNNNLKYGAAYYPALNTVIVRNYTAADVSISGGAFSGDTLTDVFNGIAASGSIDVIGGPSTLTAGDEIEINGITPAFKAVSGTPSSDEEFKIVLSGSDPDAAATAPNLVTAINNHPVAKLVVVASLAPGATATLATVNIAAISSGTAGNAITLDDTNGNGNLVASAANLSGGKNADITLYNTILAAIESNYTLTLYPSSTMAGIYASVDRDRGVWKAPANVSLTGVISPSVNISAAEQEGLNVDATSGKSINAIRAFAGKGILVWGARTLAGNDNEWRYINVRRLFIFAEESIMKASEFVVFEPNDANTWSRVRGLISNFLTNLWRDGGLVGATPEQAFFVRVGLGETMTAQDILEGKLIVEVGMAASRPAEFIILRFSHKLQEA